MSPSRNEDTGYEKYYSTGHYKEQYKDQVIPNKRRLFFEQLREALHEAVKQQLSGDNKHLKFSLADFGIGDIRYRGLYVTVADILDKSLPEGFTYELFLHGFDPSPAGLRSGVKNLEEMGFKAQENRLDMDGSIIADAPEGSKGYKAASLEKQFTKGGFKVVLTRTHIDDKVEHLQELMEGNAYHKEGSFYGPLAYILEDKKRFDTIKLFAKALAPGGNFFFTVPLYMALKKEMDALGKRSGDVDYFWETKGENGEEIRIKNTFHIHTIDEMKEGLEQAGFDEGHYKIYPINIIFQKYLIAGGEQAGLEDMRQCLEMEPEEYGEKLRFIGVKIKSDPAVRKEPHGVQVILDNISKAIEPHMPKLDSEIISSPARL